MLGSPVYEFSTTCQFYIKLNYFGYSIFINASGQFLEHICKINNVTTLTNNVLFFNLAIQMTFGNEFGQQRIKLISSPIRMSLMI